MPPASWRWYGVSKYVCLEVYGALGQAYSKPSGDAECFLTYGNISEQATQEGKRARMKKFLAKEWMGRGVEAQEMRCANSCLQLNENTCPKLPSVSVHWAQLSWHLSASSGIVRLYKVQVCVG